MSAPTSIVCVEDPLSSSTSPMRPCMTPLAVPCSMSWPPSPRRWYGGDQEPAWAAEPPAADVEVAGSTNYPERTKSNYSVWPLMMKLGLEYQFLVLSSDRSQQRTIGRIEN
ncbi:hypothetical protein GUJ93_ZPchr0008g12290 [Zizania palustris]|uniref:Uncharacterized protein n=1 Tax=Zizania palustris TaxID=103762 RepID=A0A8J5RHD7_ZIZPA|nr:hypothetical protein GUJ93_ZPchr0008g12290 [Zizania palustris]